MYFPGIPMFKNLCKAACLYKNNIYAEFVNRF